MTIIDNDKLKIKPDHHKQDYKYLVYSIILNKGFDFYLKIVSFLKKEITNWDDLSKTNQNFLIRKTFILEIKLRRFFSKYVELIEKLLSSAVNINFFYGNFNSLLSDDIEFINYQLTINKKPFFGLKFNEKLNFLNNINKKENKIKKQEINKLKGKIFNYLKSLKAINSDLNKDSNLFNNFYKILNLRNSLYHYNFLLKNKNITNGLIGLRNILSKKYIGRLKFKFINEIKNLNQDNNEHMNYFLFEISKSMLKIFQIDWKFFNNSKEEFQNYYLESCYEESEDFEMWNKDLFELINNLYEKNK